jgi:hypothetical protein
MSYAKPLCLYCCSLLVQFHVHVFMYVYVYVYRLLYYTNCSQTNKQKTRKKRSENETRSLFAFSLESSCLLCLWSKCTLPSLTVSIMKYNKKEEEEEKRMELIRPYLRAAYACQSMTMVMALTCSRGGGGGGRGGV